MTILAIIAICIGAYVLLAVNVTLAFIVIAAPSIEQGRNEGLALLAAWAYAVTATAFIMRGLL